MITVISLLLLATFTLHLLKKRILSFFSNKKLIQHRANQIKARIAHQKQTHKNLRLSYNPTNCSSLDRFLPSKMQSPCLFAKQALLWGSSEYNRNESIADNMLQIIPALCKFTSLAEDENRALDGFLIEIRGREYGATVGSFAATVRTALSALSQHDPSGLDTMQMKSISTSSWYFSFDMVPLFVTTFAPCYPPSSARRLHLTEEEHNTDSCFILLQPEVSFLRHGIGADHAMTQWQKPKTIRDKIRVHFRDKKQSYYIPSTLNYPVSTAIVHSEDGKSHSVRFWDKSEYPDKLTMRVA